MKNLLLILAALLPASCGNSTEPVPSTVPDAAAPAYTVIEQDLQVLKDAFNANQGRVRLLFISGPTCGICLRGMADLNDAFLADNQHDDRLVTFVVHVPTMGAREKHVAETIPLLSGPRIHHYWEDSGIIGQHLSEVMEVDAYVWDFWAIYGPDARWEGLLPPRPRYYEHQLGVSSGRYRTFTEDRILDADRFAKQTMRLVNSLAVRSTQESVSESTSPSATRGDGTVISSIGQPRNVAVRQHIMGRGGYRNLKRIQQIVSNGHLESGGATYDLAIVATRPNNVRRELTDATHHSIAAKVAGETSIDATAVRGIPANVEKQLLDDFEFDGLFVDWPDKGHELSMEGMRKFDDILAWKLELRQSSGTVWNLYMDSHSGDLIEMHRLDENGATALIIRQSDFRKVDGYRFPFKTEYVARDGEIIGTETIDTVSLDVQRFDIENKEVSH